MHNFGVTAWPDKSTYTIEVSGGDVTDLYRLWPEEASELLECLNRVISYNICEHELVHRIESKQGDMFTLMLSVSDRYTRAYTVSKRKLIELRIALMGALNG